MQTQWHYHQPVYRRPPGYYGGSAFLGGLVGGLGGSLIAAPFLYGGYGYGYPPYGYGPYGYPPYGYYY
ncbi:hypothetical protein [Shouchella clausii]|uniref:Uncharacterized protein n=1 Tax=Shouchella clausii TaxID=79880 RepID=A0A268RWS2_SHOCL|nr:hypothetical protein [Shouchella clausii]PAD91889.1 hypothetical protein CHH52_12115 [Shouchella clausii]PAF23911.1 hypothetical protein CHH61_21370 [Shouchella clausii]